MSQFPADRHETWITGIGLVTSLGDGLEANWDALRSGRVNVDLEKYAPWMIHPLAPVDLDSQIPKKSDQRQMDTWQRIGTYAAGLALDSAGIKDEKEILARTDMIVAAGGGERDLDVDAAILTARADGRSGALNGRLMNDLRPTLFLAQLSNLLAGNISIVHGVSGSSRTFMGEEVAGVDAVRIAWAKIASGQSEVALVGAAHNGERKEMLMLYECGGFNLKKDFTSVWSRNGGGFALGSGGVFLVLKSRPHAERRGAHGSSTSSPVIPPELPRAELKVFWKASGRPWGSPRMQPRSTRQRRALPLPPGKRQPSCRHTGVSPSARSARPSDISAKRNFR